MIRRQLTRRQFRARVVEVLKAINALCDEAGDMGDGDAVDMIQLAAINLHRLLLTKRQKQKQMSDAVALLVHSSDSKSHGLASMLLALYWTEYLSGASPTPLLPLRSTVGGPL